MKKTFTSLTIISLTLALATGLSRAFFSDTETSSGNNFSAGKIDLLIDNTSFYNGVANSETSFVPSDLPGKYFFNFNDIKPNDYGEDTISLHVDDNDAWACLQITKTKDDDDTCTEPEMVNDPNCGSDGAAHFDGELGKNVHFYFWADDGDNVFESNEVIWHKIQAEDFVGTVWPLADSTANLWNATGSAMLASQTYYIGKFWCFGNTSPSPLAQSNYLSPAADNNNNGTAGEPEDGGFSCDGSSLDNRTQTDIFMADIQFSAEQYRNNPNFRCNPNPLLVETLEIPSGDTDGVNSVNPLQNGKNYQFKVTGYWSNAGGRELVDAENISYDSWGSRQDGDPAWEPSYGITGYKDLLDLQVNNTFVGWIYTGVANIYTFNLAGNGSVVNFRVFDGNPALNPTVNAGWYGDNSGSMNVEIYEI